MWCFFKTQQIQIKEKNKSNTSIVMDVNQCISICDLLPVISASHLCSVCSCVSVVDFSLQWPRLQRVDVKAAISPRPPLAGKHVRRWWRFHPLPTSTQQAVSDTHTLINIYTQGWSDTLLNSHTVGAHTVNLKAAVTPELQLGTNKHVVGLLHHNVSHTLFEKR